MPVTTTYIVRLARAGEDTASVNYVGPFANQDAARRYGQRIVAASNGILRAEVAPMSTP